MQPMTDHWQHYQSHLIVPHSHEASPQASNLREREKSRSFGVRCTTDRMDALGGFKNNKDTRKLPKKLKTASEDVRTVEADEG